MIQRATELAEIVEGLSQAEKMISPKFLYDERGSQLFDEITRLPEYYPTETEIGIMVDNIDEIVELVGPQASLIELGSGSSVKTRILLGHLERPFVRPILPLEVNLINIEHRLRK